MKTLLVLMLAAASAFSAQEPRAAPEFAIQMPGGGQTLLSTYRGKVVILAFVFTTCPHCQHTVQVLGGIQKELGPQGLQVLAASFNPDAATLVANFNRQYVSGFPAGWAERDSVLEFLQLSDPRFYVPILVFVDRKGMVRAQYIGDAEFLKDQEKNIRALAESLLKEPAGKPVHRTAAKRK